MKKLKNIEVEKGGWNTHTWPYSSPPLFSLPLLYSSCSSLGLHLKRQQQVSKNKNEKETENKE